MTNSISQQRDCKYELIRILSIFFIVCNHTSGIIPLENPIHQYLSPVMLLSQTGVALFFFLSGKFALRKILNTDEEYKTFYFKKAIYLILPIVFFMVLQTTLKHFKDYGFTLDGLASTIISDILFNHVKTHFWFVIVLVGNILIAPFMAKAINGISKNMALVFVGLGILHNTIYAYTPYFTDVEYIWTYPFAQWSIYFYIGGCIDKIITTPRDKKIAIILGVIGLSIIILKTLFFPYQRYLHDVMPSFTFLSIMIYILLQEINVESWSEKAKKVINFLGKRSFGIYLVHMIAILGVVRITPEQWKELPVVLYYLINVLLAFICSIILSYLADIILLNPIQNLLVRLRGKKE